MMNTTTMLKNLFYSEDKKTVKDAVILALTTICFFIFFLFINHAYGFHRDELAFVDNAKHLAWGFIEYPPLTPFIAFLAIKLFGITLFGIRFFAALAICFALFITGLMVKELGGTLKTQILAGFAAITAPLVLFHVAFFSYDTFDYLWWVLTAYLLIKLLKTNNPRWWIGIGLTIGLGLLTKYTILALVAGLGISMLLTPARRYLKSPWFWSGVGVAFLLSLPNLIWQMQHHFISLEFMQSIHARDITLGRTSGFLIQQLYVTTNPVAIFFWISGLYFYLFLSSGKQYRLMGWMFVITFILLFLLQSRFYYPAPLYPMLIAAGTVYLSKRISFLWNILLDILIVLCGIGMIIVTLPTTPVHSPLWNFSVMMNSELTDEIGWQDLVKTVATICSSLPRTDKQHLGIITSNYGEAGAIDLYGKEYGLPQAISGVNSYWLRGYPNPPPKVLIVLGFTKKQAKIMFTDCKLAGHITNEFGVKNEETKYHSNIFVCHKPRQSWSEFWRSIQSFG